jgi:hyperosmotically inducible periplasmic protein
MSYTSSLKTLMTAGAAVLFAANLAAAQSEKPKPDNTRENTRDRQEGTVTADQQGNSAADLDATKKIREAIVKDKSLSTYAHNVKVITRDGTVTLRGPVRSEDERKAIEAKARSVAGAGRVVNELTVAPSGNH